MVQWNAEKDLQLLLGALEFQNITFSQALCKHLAEKIGEGCTPKAVTHRLTSLKAKAKTDASGTDGGAAPKTPMGAKTMVNTPKSVKSTGKRGRPAKNHTPEESDNDADQPSPTKRGRQVKSASKVEETDDDDETEAKVKTEAVEYTFDGAEEDLSDEV